MLGSCRLNNKSMRNVRRTDAYQAVMIDLALLGIISKEECEMLLDGGIPSGIVLPDGSSKLTSEKNLPPKPDFIKTEPVDTETGDETQTSENGVIVSDGATTDEQPSVDPVMPGSEIQTPELIFGVSGDETQTSIQSEPIVGVTVSDGATTDEQPSVDPVMLGDETGNETQTPVQPELILGVDETQEPVNDEGRTESSN